MKRSMCSRRAVSPVLAAVLMILVVMTGMSLLFAFFVNYTADFQRKTGSAVLESITVEDVWFKSATHLEIWVYNFGKVSLNVTSLYIDNQL
jgi:flagellin-like protein